MPLLLLFILVPMAEIALFIQVGDRIGLGWTLAIVVLTAFIGTALVRNQGLAVWARANQAMAENRMPLEEVFTGLCLLVAGALLLTPGFLTDTIGFCLLIPPIRAFLGRGLWDLLKSRGGVHTYTTMRDTHMHQGPNGQDPRPRNGQGPVIDGDYHEVDPDEHKPH